MVFLNLEVIALNKIGFVTSCFEFHVFKTRLAKNLKIVLSFFKKYDIT